MPIIHEKSTRVLLNEIEAGVPFRLESWKTCVWVRINPADIGDPMKGERKEQLPVVTIIDACQYEGSSRNSRSVPGVVMWCPPDTPVQRLKLIKTPEYEVC